MTCVDTKRQENIAISDIIGYDAYSYYTIGQYTENSFDCEGQRTSAVDAVVSAVTHKVYTTEGHGETALSDSLSKLMSKSHLDVEGVNLLQNGVVPGNCDTLICCAPAGGDSGLRPASLEPAAETVKKELFHEC